MPRPLPSPQQVWTEDDARRFLDEWQRSGESLSTFSRRHGVVPGRAFWWKAKLIGVRKRRLPAKAAPKLSLVPAVVVGADAAIAIRLPTGISIEVANATPTWVASMIAELTRPT